MPDTPIPPNGLTTTLVDALGGDRVNTDPTALSLFSQDLFATGPAPLAVAAPGSVDELAATVRIIADRGAVIAPRGGGMSYSNGYLPDRTDAVVIDTRRLDRIAEINRDDMYVTVEAGVTWKALDEALAAAELRTPFWGTGSGMYATVGATLSQHAMNYGSGQFGPSPASVLGLTVITADGKRLVTGSAGALTEVSPFLRHYGPDLTGLFLGDCGALGIKATATLQLIKRPQHIVYASYEYPSREQFTSTLSKLGRRQLAAEVFGFDPRFMASRSTYEGVTGALKTLGRIATADKSLASGVKSAARVARAGTAFLNELGYSIHITVEGGDGAEAASRLEQAETVLSAEGMAIQASVGRVTRAVPFPEPTMLIARTGKRWIPLHGIVPHSALDRCLDALETYMDSQEKILQEHDIEWATTMVPAGPSGILIEPNIYWPDARSSLIESYLPPSYLSGCTAFEPNPQARSAVAKLRQGLVQMFRELGAAHFQIGRFYPYAETRQPETKALLEALKQHLDPNGVMNPGVLGLP